MKRFYFIRNKSLCSKMSQVVVACTKVFTHNGHQWSLAEINHPSILSVCRAIEICFSGTPALVSRRSLWVVGFNEHQEKYIHSRYNQLIQPHDCWLLTELAGDGFHEPPWLIVKVSLECDSTYRYLFM